MAHKSVSLGFFLPFLQFYLILAQDCKDHDVKINQFRNCPEPSANNQNIKIQNLTLDLTNDCKLVPRGCFKVKKSISAAKVEYYISKPPFKKKGSEDFCKILNSPETQKYTESYKSLPRKCTISPGNYCLTKGSTKIEQLNSKTLNLMTGITTGYFSIENEGSGEKGCIEFKLTVSKKG